jgi:hypothetical protein
MNEIQESLLSLDIVAETCISIRFNGIVQDANKISVLINSVNVWDTALGNYSGNISIYGEYPIISDEYTVEIQSDGVFLIDGFTYVIRDVPDTEISYIVCNGMLYDL